MRTLRATLSLILVVVMAAGCSADASEQAKVSDTVDESSTTQLPSATEPPSSHSSTTGSTATTKPSVPDTPPSSSAPASPTPSSPATVLEPADTTLPPSGSISVNEAGQPVTLDETASLACALVDMANESVRVSNIDGAIVTLAQAASRAEPSSVEDIAEQADAMRHANAKTAGDIARTVKAVCMGHGHQV